MSPGQAIVNSRNSLLDPNHRSCTGETSDYTLLEWNATHQLQTRP